jgi:hypothetical protein
MRLTRLALLIVITAAPAQSVTSSEIDGFRLGMRLGAVRTLAAEKNYSFSNAVRSGGDRVSYFLMNGGPTISVCDEILSSVSKDYTSHLHEFTSILKDWTASLGRTPDLDTTQSYVSGQQLSIIRFKWDGHDNIRRDVSFRQWGPTDAKISYGYMYIDHPCRTKG